jgi:hypothetical protein
MTLSVDIRFFQAKEETLQNKCVALQKENTDLKEVMNSVKEQAWETHNTLQGKCRELQMDNTCFHNYIASMRAKEPIQAANKEFVQARCTELQKDNTDLHDYIIKMRSMLERAKEETDDLHQKFTAIPFFAEEAYEQKFFAINYYIERWAVAQSKANAKEIISKSLQNEILSLLSDIGRYGKASAISFRADFSALYEIPSTRVPLVCHIFTVYLLDRVLGKFGFELNNDVSDYLWAIENDLFEQSIQTFTVPN